MRFRCKVVTRSSRNEIMDMDKLSPLNLEFKDGSIDENMLPFVKIYLTSVPVGGKANKDLIKLLSRELDVNKSRINIIRGEKSKEKIIEITEIDE